MCGIAGRLGHPSTEAQLDAMHATMLRRGPDDRGRYVWEDGALLHARLAIMDPKGGRQPMVLHHGGKTYVLVYNGELYNTQELRRELEALDHQFQGSSDTEVLLHGYAQFGEGCLQRLNGIFAFAVWEVEDRRLFLARDRIGVKPLFYRQMGKELVFASELKTILAAPGVRAELDEEGAAQLLLLGPGRLPGSGVFRGIRELEPGCCGCFEDGCLTLKRYWTLTDREHMDSLPQTIEKVRFLVTDAIRRQLVADAEVGCFLSGGLDSSIISAVCAGAMEEKGKRLKTFSVDYRGNDRFFQANSFQPEADAAYIRLLRQELGTEHYATLLTPEDLTGALEAATIARDLPGMADVDFSLLAFCADIRREVKVALSGECADEIFGGYPWYRDPKVRAREGFPWAQNTDQRTALLQPIPGLDPRAFVMDAYAQTCRESDILPGTTPQERRMKELVNLNFRWFMQTLLDRKDRMSMYQGLEVRVPFCDYRIAEYLYGVPWEMKDLQGREKGLLRAAVEGLLPQKVLYRKKSPYPKTFDPAYELLVRKRLEALLQTDTPLWNLVRREEVQGILTGEMRWPWYGQLMRTPQTIAWLLQLEYWLHHYGVEFCF